MSEVHNFSKNLSHFKILSTIAKKKSRTGDLALGFLTPPAISSQVNYPASTKILSFLYVKYITKTTEYLFYQYQDG